MLFTLVCRACVRALRHQCRSISVVARNCSVPTSEPLFSHPSRPIISIPVPIHCTLTSTPLAHSASTTATAPPAADGSSLRDGSPASAHAVQRMREGPGAAFTETYVAYGTTEALFKECARQADYIVPQTFERGVETPKNADGEDIGEGTGWWYENLGLIPTFNTWAQVTFLHMYLLTVRIRYFPPDYAPLWLQHLHDHFFYEAEHRMTIFHGLSSRTIRNKYLKELYNQWRGVQGAYDEGLVKGDAVLGAAVWRNVFKGNEDVDWRRVALVVGFMRRGLRGLDRAHDRTVVGGLIKFGSPMSEMAVVEKHSKGIKEPFGTVDEDLLKKFIEQGKMGK